MRGEVKKGGKEAGERGMKEVEREGGKREGQRGIKIYGRERKGRKEGTCRRS